MPIHQRKANEQQALRASGGDDALPLVMLKQASGKSLQFRGALVAEANSYSPNIIVWHEFALYRRIEGGYILRLQVRKKLPGTEDSVHIFKGETLEKMMDAIERYMPEYDVSSNPYGDDEAMILCAKDAVTAVTLRQQIQQVRRHYDALAGDFLFALNGLATA
jgi:hypothetical protein